MFHYINLDPINFRSNPPFGEDYVIVPDKDHGTIVNKVLLVPKDNKSPLDGVHYSAEQMSLRAKLNLGIPMSRVSNPPIENDPAKLNAIALHLVDDIENRLSQIQESDTFSDNS